MTQFSEKPENDIRKIMRFAEDKRETAVTELGVRVEQQIREAKQAGVLLADFIMDTKSYRREITERIIGQPSPIDNDDFERFIDQLLTNVRTYIKRVRNVYELTFHSDFFDTPDKRHLFLGGPKMRAVFRPDSRPDAEDVEFMAFGHKIIDSIVEQVLSEKYEGVTGTRRISAGGELAPTSGWLFTYQFNISGIRPTETVVPVFVSDAEEIDLKAGNCILQRACRFDSTETEINRAEIPDNLNGVQPLANQFAINEMEKVQQHAQSEAIQRADREVSRLEKLFDYKERGARDKMEATRSTLDRIRKSSDEAQRQILPAWEANLRRDEEILNNLKEDRRRRIAEIEKYRFPQVDWALKSLGRIEVIALL